MNDFLLLASGVSWMIAYVAIILKSRADQAYGMPIVAAAANISWEFLFTVVRPMGPPQLYVNAAWLLLDVPIVYQCFRYGRGEWADRLSARQFAAGFVLTFAMAFALVFLVAAQFEMGYRYAAFGQNLMMSALFVSMRLRRGDDRGQSLTVAVAKLVGTACASLLFVVLRQSTPLLEALFVCIFILDAVYVAQLWRGDRLVSEAS